MRENDCAYYRRRAADERRRAEHCADTAAARVHLTLAELYERRAGQTDPVTRA